MGSGKRFDETSSAKKINLNIFYKLSSKIVLIFS